MCYIYISLGHSPVYSHMHLHEMLFLMEHNCTGLWSSSGNLTKGPETLRYVTKCSIHIFMLKKTRGFTCELEKFPNDDVTPAA